MVSSDVPLAVIVTHRHTCASYWMCDRRLWLILHHLTWIELFPHTGAVGWTSPCHGCTQLDPGPTRPEPPQSPAPAAATPLHPSSSASVSAESLGEPTHSYASLSPLGLMYSFIHSSLFQLSSALLQSAWEPGTGWAYSPLEGPQLGGPDSPQHKYTCSGGLHLRINMRIQLGSRKEP